MHLIISIGINLSIKVLQAGAWPLGPTQVVIPFNVPQEFEKSIRMVSFRTFNSKTNFIHSIFFSLRVSITQTSVAENWCGCIICATVNWRWHTWRNRTSLQCKPIKWPCCCCSRMSMWWRARTCRYNDLSLAAFSLFWYQLFSFLYRKPLNWTMTRFKNTFRVYLSRSCSLPRPKILNRPPKSNLTLTTPTSVPSSKFRQRCKRKRNRR